MSPRVIPNNPAKLKYMGLTHFVGTCVELKADDLHAFDDSAKPISYDRFRELIGPDAIAALALRCNYVPGEKLSLRSDWAVSFLRGLWQGRAAVVCMYSGIHHVFTAPVDQIPASVPVAAAVKPGFRPFALRPTRRTPPL